MRVPRMLSLLAVICLLWAVCSFASAGGPKIETVQERATWFAVRGWGSVYLLPEPGPLEIVVEKQDLNRYAGADILVARLLAPDREELAAVRFADDGNDAAGGGAGAIERAVIEVTVTEPGLYKLDLEARTGQQAGHDIAWGIRTNSPKVAVESSLSFLAPELAGDVYFYPRQGDFEVQVRGSGSKQKVRLFDGAGDKIQVFDTREAAVVSAEFSGPVSANAEPWRLQLEQQVASLEVDGVNRMVGRDGFYPSFGYWAPRKDLLFPVENVRWLVFPRRVVLYPMGETAEIPLTVRNGGDPGETFFLSLDAPDGVNARMNPQGQLTVPAGETVDVNLQIETPALRPDEEHRLRVNVRAKGASGNNGYATVLLRGGEALATESMVSPLVLEPYRHENFLYGYRPDYVTNVPYFDPRNRPFIRIRGADHHHSPGLQTLDPAGWREAEYLEAVKRVVPDFGQTWAASSHLANKVGFDEAGGVYTLVSVTRKDKPTWRRQALLLYTSDRGENFEAIPIGAVSDAAFELEQFTGHNDESNPPAVLLYKRTKNHPATYAWLNELRLFLPEKSKNGRVSVGPGRLVSERALNPAAHSGGGSPLATRGNLTFIAWGEAVDPDSDLPGVPTYITAYDRTSGTLGGKQFLGFAPPINDSHNSPAIVLDTKGFIHVVFGAHGHPFQYLVSKEPLRLDRGWSEPVDVLSTGRIAVGDGLSERGAQTYVGLVCGPDDVLHLVSRQWREGVDAFHDGHLYAALSYQRKRPGEPWTEPVPLVVPPLPNYSVYYHKLSIDRLGRLYLGYNYYSVHEHYREDLPGRLDHQAVLMSPDGGKSWELAGTADFREGMERMSGENK